MEAFVESVNSVVGVETRFSDLKIATEVLHHKHTQRETLSVARFSQAFWCHDAVTFVQLHCRKMVQVLDLSHSDHATDRLLDQVLVCVLCVGGVPFRVAMLTVAVLYQVQDLKFRHLLGRARDHVAQAKRGEISCVLGCGSVLVLVLDGNQVLFRTKCITYAYCLSGYFCPRMHAAGHQRAHARASTDDNTIDWCSSPLRSWG